MFACRARRLVFVCAAAASGGPAQELWGSRFEQLQKEDIRAAAEWLRRNDPFADRFRVEDKRHAAGDYSLLALSGYPDPAIRKQAPEEALRGAGSLGVFLVYGPTNQVYMVLDLRPLHALPPGAPRIAYAGEQDAVVDLWGDYNMYLGSIKYVYDLRKRRTIYKLPFIRLTFGDSTIIGPRIYYLGLGGCASSEVFECRNYALALEQFAPGEKPRYELTEVPAIPAYGPKRKLALSKRGITVGESCGGSQPPPVEHPDFPGLRHTVPPCYAFRWRDGWYIIWNEESAPRGYGARRSGVFWVPDRGRGRFYPLPVPDVATWRRFRGAEMEPWDIQNHFGAFAREGDRLWFAGTFYDGEGASGVGNLGWFDLDTRSYQLWYPPELAPWSATALFVEKDAVWIGLVQRPEGALLGGGILRYDRTTGQFTRIAVPALVNSMDRFGGAVYTGASGGIYLLRDGSVTMLSVEPVAPERWDLVVRTPSLSP
ncbi:MAG TPA: hypothetical protein VNJ11_07980 [Bryobacteraceae bacterium]|nr:hypothetical protein [Bryobacteraceae bacterium]